MKLTQILLRQHIGRHLKKHWRVQGKKAAPETPALKVLRESGVPIYEPKDILEEKTVEKVDVIKLADPPLKFDQSHPNWHDRVCLKYGDNNVLLEGLNQAKSLLKVVEIQDGLPDVLKIKNSSNELDERVRRIIMNSHVFDAEQKKLPKIKDPARPAWNFPRIYGITSSRAYILLISKLLQLVEMSTGPQLTNKRMILNDLNFVFPFEKEEDLIQFELKADTAITATKPLEPVTKNCGVDMELPRLEPIRDTITLIPENVYEINNFYPIKKTVNTSHLHTIFIHFNPTEVKNIYEEEVTDNQILGRSLMKTFTAAASYARNQFGNDVIDLPKPVTLQCVQTDGRLFDFGVLQLNTLNFSANNNLKNVWYHTGRLPLFSTCAYVMGKPVLEGYNNEVIKIISAFYNNV